MKPSRAKYKTEREPINTRSRTAVKEPEIDLFEYIDIDELPASQVPIRKSVKNMKIK